MRKGILIFLAWLMMGCFSDRVPDVVVRASDEAYLCEDYEVPNESKYRYGAPIEYKIKVINLKGSEEDPDVNAPDIVEYLNSSLNDYNFYYHLSGDRTEVWDQLNNKRVRYRDLLEDYWNREGYGFITILILPNYVDIVEGPQVGGAALGIPEKWDPSRGKPIFFLRQKYVNTGVMVHELLHTKGGHHTFKASEYIDNTPSCDSGDFVSTTPVPEPDYGVGNRDCQYYPGDKDRLTKEEQDIIRYNFLSYAPPHCMKTAQIGQVERFRFIASIHPLLQAAENRAAHNDIFSSK